MRLPRGARVEVFHGSHRTPDAPLFGPLPGVRLGDALAYEYELPEAFEPWPGRTRVQRTYVLLDVGVSLSEPCWKRHTNADGEVYTVDDGERGTWYVDLVSVDGYVFRDLYADVMVPTDGRAYRMLDLEELAEAAGAGLVSQAALLDGLARWQRFLDRHLHGDRFPPAAWTDFPPAAIKRLMELPEPLAPPVRWLG